jgi:hypothetical protein
MNKIVLSVLAIVIAIVFFVLGAGLGIFYQDQKNNSQPMSASSAKLLGSRIIPSIMVSGKVSKLEGRNITIISDGDTAVIPISDGATVYSFISSEDSSQKESDFSQIKVGDRVNISLKWLQDGGFVGETIIIIP